MIVSVLYRAANTDSGPVIGVLRRRSILSAQTAVLLSASCAAGCPVSSNETLPAPPHLECHPGLLHTTCRLMSTTAAYVQVKPRLCWDRQDGIEWTNNVLQQHSQDAGINDAQHPGRIGAMPQII